MTLPFHFSYVLEWNREGTRMFESRTIDPKPYILTLSIKFPSKPEMYAIKVQSSKVQTSAVHHGELISTLSTHSKDYLIAIND